MARKVLFIHGAGEGAYQADKLLAQKFQKELGADYDVLCPEMPDEDNAPYEIWKQQVKKAIDAMDEPAIVVGHSIGGSHLVKIMSEIKTTTSVAGVFILDAPFWGGDGWLYEGYKELVVADDAAKKFPTGTEVFLYHTKDDEVVPFEHLALYAKLLPRATVREISRGGHQLDDDISAVVQDIQKLD